ncbi:hypothetical protein [Mesorhizobium sp. CN2-181]|uniref:hypothetical protein n=1 Tax=Mesorhizobium yinganensis TaxID=3157707 RepID=UPI0032B822D8
MIVSFDPQDPAACQARPKVAVACRDLCEERVEILRTWGRSPFFAKPVQSLVDGVGVRGVLDLEASIQRRSIPAHDAVVTNAEAIELVRCMERSRLAKAPGSVAQEADRSEPPYNRLREKVLTAVQLVLELLGGVGIGSDPFRRGDKIVATEIGGDAENRGQIVTPPERVRWSAQGLKKKAA